MLNKQFYYFLVFFIFSLNVFSCSAITCKDESGKSVDWFIVYKIPKLEKRRDQLSLGLSYAFVTSNDNSAWKLSERKISDANSLFGINVTPLFSKSATKTTHLFYNDQLPNGKHSSSAAHAKGVIAMDSDTGFWLTHSVPKYPTPANETYKYPDSGDDNGQTALCVSFSTAKQGEKVINHLLTLRPQVYSSSYDEDTMKIVPNLNILKARKWSKQNSQQITVNSIKNTDFVMFSKNGKSGIDLYETDVAPFIKGDLFVESWRRGSGNPLPSNCKSTYKLINVQDVSLKFGSNSGNKGVRTVLWSYREDHSKWSISEDSKKAFVCIADLNRMLSQNKRGGGAVCIRNSSVWKLFHDSIAAIETCTKR